MNASEAIIPNISPVAIDIMNIPTKIDINPSPHLCLLFIVPPVGIEPTLLGLRIPCFTTKLRRHSTPGRTRTDDLRVKGPLL